ncbi:hypothetical protein CBF34_07055 [Vagococcus penaei]|uniref:minor capsid protein n=1 Tax=Vagococcus penaei TaxID=633807 RepID=UPI000F85EAC5|nr:minor capsid protein [Vagococcus penaei]RSU01410.1 hypothetical protein CBF34_07055 [Vagococcus penaei]
MDFYERLSDFLLNQLELKSAFPNDSNEGFITFEPISNNERGIAILDAPSTTNQRYFDRSRVYDWSVQVVVKNIDQQQAFSDAMSIYQECDDLPRPKKDGLLTIISSNDSFELLSASGYTMPRMIEKTVHNAYVYSFLLKFDLFINAKKG